MQAVKRNHCYRLSCYIRLCDYLVVTMLHNLIIFSMEDLLHNFQKLVDQPVEIEDIAEPIPEDEMEDEKVPLLPLRTPVSSNQNTPSVRLCD